MIDFNQALTFSDAMKYALALDVEGVYWIEEPIGHDDYRDMALIAQAAKSPIQDELCPVCGRDFAEISDTPLAAHVSEEVQQLIAAAGRVQALVRDRSSTSGAVTQAQRRQTELTTRRLSESQRDQNKLDLAQFTEWKTALAALAEAASHGSRVQREASTAAGQLSVLTTQQAGVRGLRAELVQHAQAIGMPSPTEDAPLQVVSARLMAEVQRMEEALRAALSRHHHTLALQLSFCFEVRALSDRVVSSTPV
jgi:exonuclease SbcC